MISLIIRKLLLWFGYSKIPDLKINSGYCSYIRNMNQSAVHFWFKTDDVGDINHVVDSINKGLIDRKYMKINPITNNDFGYISYIKRN